MQLVLYAGTCTHDHAVSVSSALPQLPPPLSHHFAPTLSYICGPIRSTQLHGTFTDDPEPTLNSLQRARLQSSPSSCCSDWDSSLWNTMSSVMDSSPASARTSLISSVDSCYTSDSTSLAHLLAAAAETLSGASLSGKQRQQRCPEDFCSLLANIVPTQVNSSSVGF